MSSFYDKPVKCGMCSKLQHVHYSCDICGNICGNCIGLHTIGSAFQGHTVGNTTENRSPDEMQVKNEPVIQRQAKPEVMVTNRTSDNPPVVSLGFVPQEDEGMSHIKETASCHNHEDECALCSEKHKPHSHCNTCGHICGKCIDSHKKGKAFRGHEVKDVGEHKMMEPIQQQLPDNTCTTLPLDNSPSTSTRMQTPKKPQTKKRKLTANAMEGLKEAFCRKHKTAKLEFSCQDCDEAICGQCIITVHKGHSHDELTVFFDKKKAKIEEDLLIIDSHIKQREKAKQTLSKEQEKMKNGNVKAISKEIKESVDKIASVFQQRAEAMQQEIEDKTKMISERMKDYSTEIRKLKSIQGRFQDKLDKKDAAVILFSEDTSPIPENLKNLPKMYAATAFRFIPGALNDEMFNQIGTIVPPTLEEKEIVWKAPSKAASRKPKKQKVSTCTSIPITATDEQKEVLRNALNAVARELN